MSALAKFYGVDVSDVTVDRDGTVYLIRHQDDAATIDVIATDGTVTPLTYRGQSRPVALSMGQDGTLYVADRRLGLVALVGVGAGVAADGGG